MKRVSIIFIIYILTNLNLSSQNSWVAITQSDPSTIELTARTFTDVGLSFQMKVGGFYAQEVTVDNNVYQRIQIPGCNSNEQKGHPELPFFSELIAIPECSGISVTLTPIGNPVTLAGYKIYPRPDYIEQEVNGYNTLVEKFAIDNLVYNNISSYPSSQAVVQEMGKIRAQGLARLVIYPIVFNPIDNSITYYEEYIISVEFENPISQRIANVGVLGSVLKNSIMNHDGSEVAELTRDNMVKTPNLVYWHVLNSPSDADLIDADYLIITAGKFFHLNNTQSETYRIAKHRAQFNGYKVAILNVENIVSDAVGFASTNSVYKDEQRIRECIKRIYNNGLAKNTFDGHLGFVLLIGEPKHTVIINDKLYNDNFHGLPAAYENIWNENYNPPVGNPISFPNDHYYACLTQSTINNQYRYDYFGDVSIGRFPVDNHVQLHNMVEKTIKYETEANLNSITNSLFTNGNGLSNDPTSTVYQTYFASQYGFYNEFLPRLITPPYQFTARDA